MTLKANTIRIDQYRQYREIPLIPDMVDLVEAEPAAFPQRDRDFVNCSPDVPVPGSVHMVPAGRMEPGVCPACLKPFHYGDTMAVSDGARYIQDEPKFHAYCWKRASDDRMRRVAKMAELQFGGGLS